MSMTLFPEYESSPVVDDHTFADLCGFVESRQMVGRYYIAANTSEGLYRWIGNQWAVNALKERVLSEVGWREQLAERTYNLFFADFTPGYRIESESALCCYIYILTHVHDAAVRKLISEIEEKAGPQHGWLRVLLRRLRRHESTNVRHHELYLLPKTILTMGHSSPDFSISNESAKLPVSHIGNYIAVSEEIFSEALAA